MFTRVKVHRDFHVGVTRSVDSAPKEYLDCLDTLAERFQPSRQRDHQDCVVATLDALSSRPGRVATITADFVPISGYKRSKN